MSGREAFYQYYTKVMEAEPLSKLSIKDIESQYFWAFFSYICAYMTQICPFFLLHFRKERCTFSWLYEGMHSELVLLSPCTEHTWQFFFHFHSRMCHYCWSHWMQRICLYVPLLLALFMPQHLGQNSLSSLLKAAAPRLAPISACAQQLQQQQQHTVSEPWLAVDVEMGGITSYYRVICVYLHVMTV